MKYFQIFIISSILTINILPVSGQTVLVEVGLQEQLLVDNFVVVKNNNIICELGKPTKIGVVMGPTIPTDFDPVKQFPDGTGGHYEFPGSNHFTSEDTRQIVAVHNTITNPFIVPGFGGRIGNPFPSYWDGMWHVYTLRKGLDVVLHFTSTDLVVWNEHKPAMVGSGIATGTVLQHDNKFYMFYTDAEPQTIRLVISDNPWYFDFSKSLLIAEADNKVYTLENEKYRDCYVFYYEKENLWWMLVEATSQGNVAVGLFKSEDLLNWTQQDPIFIDPVREHGSCPQLIEKGGRWYLPMLDYPTWYYVADDPYGPWELGGFYPTKRMSAASRWDTDSKRWLGWGFFTTDDTPEGDIDWEDYGPMCVGRELVFNKDGSLSVRPIEERVLSIEDYRSKMKAGWLGQMVGVGWGGPTEFKWKGEIIPADKMPEWQPEMVNQFNQDDIYVEMTFLRTLELHGFDVSTRQAGIDFANSKYGLALANRTARVNLRNGIAPPDAGHPRFNRHADDIDYQIEADFSGLISPGLSNEVIRLGEVFGRLMNYGDGLYSGQFVGGMYAEAFFEKDIHKIIQAGLACVPKRSQFHECITDVIKWHRQNPDNWQKTWELIEAKYQDNPDYRRTSCLKGSFNIDAKLNAAYIVMGLLYGEGDIDKTIIVSTRCGQDSDCNPSNAAGILFTAMGYSNIPERFTSALKPGIKFSHTSYNFDSLTRVCEKLAREAVIKSGGRVQKDALGKEAFVIPVQKAKPSKLEQSWEPGPITNSKYTSEERDKMDLDVKLIESINGPDEVIYRYDIDFQEDEFLRKWLILGPMPYVGREDVYIDSNIDGVPMTRREIKHVFGIDAIDVVDFRPKVTIDGKEYEWAVLAAKDDVIDLTELVKEDPDYKVAYLWAQIEMPMDRRYLLGVGYQNGVKIWLNGELVHENWSDWQVVIDDDRFWVDLKKGKNQIVMKVQSGESPMGFCFRLLDW